MGVGMRVRVKVEGQGYLNRPRRRVAQRANGVPLVRIRPVLGPGLGLVRVRVGV